MFGIDAIKFGVQYPVKVATGQYNLISLQYKFIPSTVDDSQPNGTLETNQSCTSAEIRLPCNENSTKKFESFRGGIVGTSDSLSSVATIRNPSLPYFLMVDSCNGDLTTFLLTTCSSTITNIRQVRLEEDLPILDRAGSSNSPAFPGTNKRKRTVKGNSINTPPKSKKKLCIAKVHELYAAWKECSSSSQ